MCGVLDMWRTAMGTVNKAAPGPPWAEHRNTTPVGAEATRQRHDPGRDPGRDLGPPCVPQELPQKRLLRGTQGPHPLGLRGSCSLAASSTPPCDCMTGRCVERGSAHQGVVHMLLGLFKT